ncbi:hypothetical protein [Undibacterium sp. YM2]|nr:hypothetical protein [Undibacterium sp. YM2]
MILISKSGEQQMLNVAPGADLAKLSEDIQHQSIMRRNQEQPNPV